MTEFVGVLGEPGQGIVEPIGPYQFVTDTGVPVYLHDADFLGLVWLPDAALRFYFAYDSGWTPVEAKATPVVQLTFSQVQLLRWETEMDAVAQIEPALGQVSDFAWDGADGFLLATYTLDLSFTARRMTVHLLAFAPEEMLGADSPNP